MINNIIWDKIQNNPTMLEHLAKKPISVTCKKLSIWTIEYIELVCKLDSIYN